MDCLLKELVGMRGFEPPTSRSRTERANRTALHPDRLDGQNPMHWISVKNCFELSPARYSDVSIGKEMENILTNRQLTTSCYSGVCE